VLGCHRAEEGVGGREAVEGEHADVGTLGLGDDVDEDCAPVVGDGPAEGLGQVAEKDVVVIGHGARRPFGGGMQRRSVVPRRRRPGPRGPIARTLPADS